MGNEWKWVPVSQVAEPVLGGTPKRSGPGYWGGNIKWATAKDIVAAQGRRVYQTEETITPLGVAQSAAKILPKGTVVITARGTVGAVVQLGDDMAFNQTCYGLVTKPEIDQDFLYYALKATLRTAYTLSYGTVFDTITKKTFEQWHIPLPLLIEQRAIAHILSTLDDKIELNRRMNETLEAIARAIFKSWFVDFAPVRAKMKGRWKRGESLPGLPPDLYDLFPDRLVDSELGEIPEGWEVKIVGDLADVVGGSTPSTKEAAYWDGGTHHWATPKDLSALSIPVLLDTERRITDAGLAQISSGLLPTGTVLLSSRAPIGYLAIAEVPVAINQGFIAMKSKKGVSNLFLLLWAGFAHDEILSRANGSTFLEISKANFRSIPLVTPPPNIMKVFDDKIRPLYARIVSNERESHTLTALRDILLPKLISGELRVNSMEGENSRV